MTFAYWMLIAAVMMPYLTIALAKSAGGVDNRAPRRSLESLSGWRGRVLAAAASLLVAGAPPRRRCRHPRRLAAGRHRPPGCRAGASLRRWARCAGPVDPPPQGRGRAAFG
jgi:hypothetical protein